MKLYGKTKELISEIDLFWDTISKSVLVFDQCINNYIDKKEERFEINLKEINRLENEADSLRKEIKYKLYTQMLIPEARGDVLGLLETSDNVIDSIKKVLLQFDIEKPEIPEFLEENFRDLTKFSFKAVDEMVMAARAFFREISIVNDHINKVKFYEHEADKVEVELKRKIFNSKSIDMLSKKVQLRYFAEKVVLISDEAESVADRLAVYVIKKTC